MLEMICTATSVLPVPGGPTTWTHSDGEKGREREKKKRERVREREREKEREIKKEKKRERVSDGGVDDKRR